MKSQGYMLSGKDNWGTPQKLFNDLDKEFNFTLDPCCDPRRILKKNMIGYPENTNGLKSQWFGSVFVNPPYTKGQYVEWVKKCYNEAENCDVIVLLLPARTDTKCFHKYIYNIAQIRFLKGRLKFWDLDNNKEQGSATFPSMICIFRSNGYEQR